MKNAPKSIAMDVELSEADYRKLDWPSGWPLFRIESIWHYNSRPPYHARFVSCGADAERLPRVEIDGRMVNFGSTLYVKGGPNDGRKVKVVGFNLEHEPIVQAADGLPLFWPANHPRHVVDIPPSRLSWEKPEPTLYEAARAVVNTAIARADRSHDRVAVRRSVYDDLAAAVEREEARAF